MDDRLMAKSDTWMAFYVGDYVADTLHLTTRQHGAYLLLILAAWKNSGWVRASAAQAITKLSNKEWQQDRETLADFFEVAEDTWTHCRVTEEWATAREISEERSKAGANGAAKRWQGHRKRKAKPSQNDAPSPSQETTNVVSPRKTKFPDDLELTEKHIAYATAQGCPDPQDTWQRFKLYHQKEGTAAADWWASWQYWCRNEKNFRRASDAPRNGSHAPPMAQDPWQQRMASWRTSKFWQPMWGPKPGESGCVVPKQFLGDA